MQFWLAVGARKYGDVFSGTKSCGKHSAGSFLAKPEWLTHVIWTTTIVEESPVRMPLPGLLAIQARISFRLLFTKGGPKRSLLNH